MAEQPNLPLIRAVFPDDIEEINRFSMVSDSAFVATPIRTAAVNKENFQDVNSQTPLNRMIAFQRDPFDVQEPSPVVVRQILNQSNESVERQLPSIEGVLEQAKNTLTPGRERSNSESTVANFIFGASKNTQLTRSPSVHSYKSVYSIHAPIGAYGFGTLRVHEPPPARYEHEVLLEGDVLVLRDIPPGTVIGYDTNCFVSGSKPFEGIKNIPPGAHFIWGGSTKKKLRTGFWFMTKKKGTAEFGDIWVKKYDDFNEVICEEVSAAERRIQCMEVPEFAHALESHIAVSQKYLTSGSDVSVKDPEIWNKLTCCIKGSFLQYITGFKWNQWYVTSVDDNKEVGPARLYNKDGVLSFVVPKFRTWSSYVLSVKRDELPADNTNFILNIFGSCVFEDSDQIIGELQFCYITGMVLGNSACQDHWVRIVKLLFSSFKLALVEPVFFKKFLEAVHAQFLYDDAGIDGSIFDQDDNLDEDLNNILIIFKSRFNELLLRQRLQISDEQAAVGKAFEDFEAMLWKFRGGWDLRGGNNLTKAVKAQIHREAGEDPDNEDADSLEALLPSTETDHDKGPLLKRTLRKLSIPGWTSF